MSRPATLFFVRHAAIECSRDGAPLLCGSHDARLSAEGRAQVELLRKRLAALTDVTALYSSPLLRAVETAQAAPDHLRTRLRLLRSLAEIHCGEVEGMPLGDIQQRYPEVWRRNFAQDDDTFAWPGGETYARFRRRVLRAVRATATTHRGERVLVVTHAGVINQVLSFIAGQSAARWEIFRPGNATVTEVMWSGLTGEVVLFDDGDHLR